MTKALCASCALIGRKGYCAPQRCYCGHKTCHAYASWTPMPEPRIADSKPKRGLPLDYLAERSPEPKIPDVAPRATTTWDEREDATWIDKL